MAETYEQGVVDGLRLYGDACARQGDCASCPIGALADAGVSCRDLLRQSPEKVAGLLNEMVGHELTFYEEYCLRFPETGMSVEELGEFVCRRVVFEGVASCQGGDCKACWSKPYELAEAPAEEEVTADEISFL